mmetsp:Transcript_63236/g.150823  ORF Transcript_63236/g.150823 Transcript_63236/m.150823 type:complete len:938 (+) Transcript_63236:79-2892(+)
MVCHCGLLALGSGNEVALPLTSVHLDVLVVRSIAQSTLTQSYLNSRSECVSAKYIFPVPDTAAVTGFVATFNDGRKVEAKIKERGAARADFAEAVSRGASAALLEEQRADIFEVSIGNLAAGEEVEVSLVYCMVLTVDRDALRLAIPWQVAPRYTPAGSTSSSDLESLLASHAHDLDTTFSAAVTWEAPDSGALSISSPTHPTLLKREAAEAVHRCSARLEGGSLDVDVVLLLQPENLWQPRVDWEEWPESKTQALLLTLVPKFELPRIQKPTVIFIIDCSGSMRGSRMSQAKSALRVCLRQLPEDAGFNMVKFGHTFSSFAKDTVQNSDANRAQAAAFVEDLHADMGGTEMLEPLRFAVSAAGDHRQVILITDGKVRNEQAVIDVVRGRGCRVFPLGVGSGVSTLLVNGVARASSGCPAFVQDGEDLDQACLTMLQKALTPSVSDLSITWPACPTKTEVVDEDGFVLVDAPKPEVPERSAPKAELSFFDPEQRDPDAFKPKVSSKAAVPEDQLLQAPARPQPIFAGAIFQAFALYPQGRGPAAGEYIEVRGQSASGSMKLRVPLPGVPVSRASGVIHRLAARSLIRDLEEGDAVEVGAPAAASRLSLRFSVLCLSTAFIAVDERDGAQRVVSKRQDVQHGQQAQEAPALQVAARSSGRQSFSSGLAPSCCVTGAVSWRAEAIKYRKNEVFIDFIERVNLLVSSDGSVLIADADGSVNMKAFLSGVPEVKLALSDKLDPSDDWLQFHQCVRLSRWDLDRTVSFVPPDGEFTLMKYKVRQAKAPLQVKAVVAQSWHDKHSMDLNVQVKSLFKESLTAHSVEITIPLPPDADPRNMKVSAGEVDFCFETQALKWCVRQLHGNKDMMLTANFSPASAAARWKEPAEIMVSLSMPGVLASGLEIRYLKVIEKAGYETCKNVRYLTSCKDCRYRFLTHRVAC